MCKIDERRCSKSAIAFAISPASAERSAAELHRLQESEHMRIELAALSKRRVLSNALSHRARDDSSSLAVADAALDRLKCRSAITLGDSSGAQCARLLATRWRIV